MNIQEALQWGKNRLKDKSDTNDLDSFLLLKFVLRKEGVDVIAHPEYCLIDLEKQQFQDLVEKRCQAIPISYLLQESEFWSLTFNVNSACLIPRPETELLIEKILDYYPYDQSIRVLDLGTGSGNIAIALKFERPTWSVTAVDKSQEALRIAEENATKLKTNIDFAQSDWFSNILPEKRFHTIVSNPPYVAKDDQDVLSTLRYEPAIALIAENRGLSELYTIIECARKYLYRKGCLWLEHGYDQGHAVKDYFKKMGYCQVVQYKDLAGVVRCSKASYL